MFWLRNTKNDIQLSGDLKCHYFQLLDCGVLEHPCNGLVLTPDGTTLDDEATYVCHFGYELSEDVVRTCESGGHWSGEAPCCDPSKSVFF